MPIYEYQCQACGHEFETLQKFSDALLTRCPSCGKNRLKKKVSAAAFRLKGGGWYETDFKSGDKKNVAGSADAGESSDASAKNDTSTGGKSSEKATETKTKSAAASDGASKNGDAPKSKSPAKRSSKATKRDTKGGGAKKR